MSEFPYVGMIYNAALLLALGLVFDTIPFRYRGDAIWSRIQTGFLLSCVSIAIMTNPWVLMRGVFFDTRSILLSVSALFLGLVPTLIAGTVTLVYRLWQGGSGVWVGSSVIVSSMLWGFLWRSRHKLWLKPYGWLEFYVLGVFNHCTMLALMLFLPERSGLDVLSKITIPVIIIYPVATALLGLILTRKIKHSEAEAALEKVSSRQTAILASVPDIIMEVDNDRIYTWANQAGFDFFGEDVIGREAKHYFVREQVTYEIVTPLFQGEDHIIYVESWQRRNDGEERLLGWWCKVLKTSDGKVIGALSTARDITDQKQAEEELNNYFANALDMFCIADTDGYFRRLNRSWEAALGYRIEDLENVQFLDFVHPDDLDATLNALNQLKEQQQIINFTNRYRHQDGSYRWIEWRGLPSGKMIYAAARDITEIKQSQDDLLKAKREWEEIFQAIPHPTFVMDKDQNILMANKYVEDALGLTIQQMQGKKCWELMHKHNNPQPPAGCPFAESITQNLGMIAEMEVEALGGWYLVSCKPIYHKDGSLDKVIHIATDITARKKAEQEMHEMQLLFSSFMDKVPGNVFIKSDEGRILFVNNYMKQSYGAEGWIGKSPGEIFDPDKAKAVIEDDQIVLKQRKKQMTDGYLRPDGSMQYFETTKFVIEQEGGQKLIGGLALDVTDKTIAEQEAQFFAKRLEILNEIDRIALEDSPISSVCKVVLEKIEKLVNCSILSINEFHDNSSRVLAILTRDDQFKHLRAGSELSIDQGFVREL